MFVNDFAERVEALDPCANPAIYRAGIDQTFKSRLGFRFGQEFQRKGCFTIGPNEPYSETRSFYLHADLFFCRTHVEGLPGRFRRDGQSLSGIPCRRDYTTSAALPELTFLESS